MCEVCEVRNTQRHRPSQPTEVSHWPDGTFGVCCRVQTRGKRLRRLPYPAAAPSCTWHMVHTHDNTFSPHVSFILFLNPLFRSVDQTFCSMSFCSAWFLWGQKATLVCEFYLYKIPHFVQMGGRGEGGGGQWEPLWFHPFSSKADG